MRVAILGAGSAGSCAALELASRGVSVDLYDENDEPITRASLHNEGKIHLGLLYAKDESLNTSRLMIEGALQFSSLLSRWIDFDSAVLSTPFLYAVHRGSMVSVERLERHYARCERAFEETQARLGTSYLGLETTLRWRRMPETEAHLLLSPEHFEAVFETSERAVDPRTVAVGLRAAVRAEPLIRFVGSTRVRRVERRGGSGFRVHFVQGDEAGHESYEQVANTLWHGRLKIDEGMGLAPEQRWLFRYKFANRVFVPLAPDDVPSVTCVLGSFGDVVNFGERGYFLSWYPVGMIGSSGDLSPPDWDAQLDSRVRYDIFQRSLGPWLERCPRLAEVAFTESDVDPGGGVIFAWGDSDIDDPASLLHTRYEIGVHTVDGYHTVNTGKYTTAPLMGYHLAQRVRGET